MEKPIIKAGPVLDYVNYLENKLGLYEKSPYSSSYLACKTTIDRWNEQLMETEISLLDSEQKPMFDMAHKYLTEQKPYIDQLEYLRGKMSPDDKKAADEIQKTQSLGIAEKLAVRNNGGH